MTPTPSDPVRSRRGRRAVAAAIAAVVTLACSSLVAFFASSALRSDLVRRLGTLVSADTVPTSKLRHILPLWPTRGAVVRRRIRQAERWRVGSGPHGSGATTS